MIRAIIFDFDGLILETEEPIFIAWQELYQSYGCELTFEAWSGIIGMAEATFDPLVDLERQYGRPIPQETALAARQARELELILSQPVLPGVEQYLEDARRLGLKLGLASSSTCAWVLGHLERLGLLPYFEVIRGSDDVRHAKPDPELYLSALAGLGVPAGKALALEDSPNGVRAAKAAGLFAVAVPNALTRRLPLEHADLILPSLEHMPLEELIRFVEQKRNGHALGPR